MLRDDDSIPCCRLLVSRALGCELLAACELGLVNSTQALLMLGIGVGLVGRVNLIKTDGVGCEAWNDDTQVAFCNISGCEIKGKTYRDVAGCP